MLATVHKLELDTTHSVKIIFFLNLFVDLLVHLQSENKWIMSARGSRGINIDETEAFL